jgi:hypothetical protein
MIPTVAGMFVAATSALTPLPSPPQPTTRLGQAPGEPITVVGCTIRSEGPLDNGRHQRDADWHRRNAIERDGDGDH